MVYLIDFSTPLLLKKYLLSLRKALSTYFHDWSLAGVSRMWLGLSDIENSNCAFKWTDSNSYDSYTNWDPDPPVCPENANSCAYINTGVSGKNWEAGTCDQLDAFACEGEGRIFDLQSSKFSSIL